MNFAEASLGDSFRSQIGSKVWWLLARVSDFLAGQNIKAYVVGGLVRDMLLGRDSADIDLAVASDALEVASKLATTLGGKYVLLDKLARTGRVVLIDKEAPSARIQWQLDFSTLEGSIEQDLSRRDFTIDAMAIDLSQVGKGFSALQLIDPFHGRDDLRQGVIRVVAETAFADDALRLLRAVRLAAELGLTIDKPTEALIQRHAHLVADVAGERVREELVRLLAVAGTGQILSYLDQLGLLTAVFPEMARAKGIEQPKEHFWDVFEHSLKTVTAVEFLLRQGAWEYTAEDVLAAVPWSALLAQHFSEEVSHGSSRGSLLKLAALLHDVAKPQTKAVDTGGRMRFLGHTEQGAEMAASMLSRLRFSAKEIKLVETAVKCHLRPGQMSQDELPTRRAIYRYFRDCGEAGIEILFLNLADHLAARGPHLNRADWQRQAQVVAYVLVQHFEPESITRSPKLVDGHDLINLFGLKPGPEIGEILELVHEAQASEEVTSREEALSLIEKVRKKYG